MTKIILIGTGGQGIKLLAHLLGEILHDLKNKVSLTYEYDTAIRGGNITGFLSFNRQKILNPIIEEADIVLNLSPKKTTNFHPKITLSEEKFHFTELAVKNFQNPRVANMIALGQLLKILKINPAKINLTKKLPEKFRETNTEAIKFGYQL